LQILFRKSH